MQVLHIYSTAITVQWSLYFTSLYFKTTLVIRLPFWSQTVIWCSVLAYHFKTTCNTRPHFQGSMGILKIDVRIVYANPMVPDYGYFVYDNNTL